MVILPPVSPNPLEIGHSPSFCYILLPERLEISRFCRSSTREKNMAVILPEQRWLPRFSQSAVWLWLLIPMLLLPTIFPVGANLFSPNELAAPAVDSSLLAVSEKNQQADNNLPPFTTRPPPDIYLARPAKTFTKLIFPDSVQLPPAWICAAPFLPRPPPLP